MHGHEMLVERILVIYDDPGSQRDVSRTLERAKYEVTTVAYGSFTIDVFRAARPGLVALDVCLPRKSGQDLCRRIRNDSMRVPLLVLSNAKNVEDVVLSLDLGADDYITKPFSAMEFLDRVRSAIRTSILINATKVEACKDNVM